MFGETKGITKKDADWSKAKVMHYQARSMEHFIERAKNKKNITFSTNIWLDYDFKDVIDKSAQKEERNLKEIITKYIEITIRRISKKIRSSFYFKNLKKEYLLDTIINIKSMKIFSIKNHEGNFIKFDRNGAFPCVEKEENILSAIFFENSKLCFLCSAGGEHFEIINEKRLVGLLKYKILFEENNVFFLHPDTNLFLSCGPLSCGGEVSVDRRIAKNWERFFLEEITDKVVYNKILEKLGIEWSEAIRSIPIACNEISFSYIFDENKTIESICMAINLLPEESIILINNYFGGSKEFIL